MQSIRGGDEHSHHSRPPTPRSVTSDPSTPRSHSYVESGHQTTSTATTTKRSSISSAFQRMKAGISSLFSLSSKRPLILVHDNVMWQYCDLHDPNPRPFPLSAASRVIGPWIRGNQMGFDVLTPGSAAMEYSTRFYEDCHSALAEVEAAIEIERARNPHTRRVTLPSPRHHRIPERPLHSPTNSPHAPSMIMPAHHLHHPSSIGSNQSPRGPRPPHHHSGTTPYHVSPGHLGHEEYRASPRARVAPIPPSFAPSPIHGTGGQLWASQGPRQVLGMDGLTYLVYPTPVQLAQVNNLSAPLQNHHSHSNTSYTTSAITTASTAGSRGSRRRHRKSRRIPEVLPIYNSPSLRQQMSLGSREDSFYESDSNADVVLEEEIAREEAKRIRAERIRAEAQAKYEREHALMLATPVSTARRNSQGENSDITLEPLTLEASLGAGMGVSMGTQQDRRSPAGGGEDQRTSSGRGVPAQGHARTGKLVPRLSMPPAETIF